MKYHSGFFKISTLHTVLKRLRSDLALSRFSLEEHKYIHSPVAVKSQELRPSKGPPLVPLVGNNPRAHFLQRKNHNFFSM